MKTNYTYDPNWEPEFGKQYEVDWEYQRSCDDTRDRLWVAIPTGLKQGVFLGYRYLSNGNLCDHGEGKYLHVTDRIKVAYFCIEGQNAKYVPVSRLRKLI